MRKEGWVEERRPGENGRPVRKGARTAQKRGKVWVIMRLE